MKNCYFVSDLHLFSKRSRGHLHQGAIERAAADADAFVLAGDNFDFHWSTFGSIEKSAAAAARWLERLARGAPG
ncbi:MAG: UDP-2,3-diacylglucosamine pyrophosphatase LpxH, partial [Candidatus Binatia bacterium]